MAVAFYSGTFDPPTLGHADIIRRSARTFDRLVVGIGTNASKAPMFALDERKGMLMALAAEAGVEGRTQVIEFAGLAVNAARETGASVIVRGLRDAADFAYEVQMAGMNAAMAPDVETVFLTASPGTAHITSTLVRQVIAMGGPYEAFLPQSVAARIRALRAG